MAQTILFYFVFSGVRAAFIHLDSSVRLVFLKYPVILASPLALKERESIHSRSQRGCPLWVCSPVCSPDLFPKWETTEVMKGGCSHAGCSLRDADLMG